MRLTRCASISGRPAREVSDDRRAIPRYSYSRPSRQRDHEADEVRQISIRDRPWALTPRKMLFHVLFHEVRHWAQVALALRLAGFDPPGNHDLLFSTALR